MPSREHSNEVEGPTQVTTYGITNLLGVSPGQCLARVLARSCLQSRLAQLY